MLFKEAAEVIQVEKDFYNNYDFQSWAEVSEYKKIFEELNGSEDWIYTPNLTLEIPRIIRLLNYNKIPQVKVRLCRRNIFHRDNNHCMYCGHKFKPKNLNIDHVVPKSKGGRSIWENLVCACFKCNQKKDNRTPREAGLLLVKKPVEPKFLPIARVHFGSKKYKSWENFLSSSYWSVEIEG